MDGAPRGSSEDAATAAETSATWRLEQTSLTDFLEVDATFMAVGVSNGQMNNSIND
jgi:hypothetical protein